MRDSVDWRAKALLRWRFLGQRVSRASNRWKWKGRDHPIIQIVLNQLRKIYRKGTSALELTSEADLLQRIDAQPQAIDALMYQQLSAMRMRVRESSELTQLDPFSADYRNCAFSLYQRLANRTAYNPSNDERSGIGQPEDVWRLASPFSFGNSKFVSEFLTAWAALFDALDVTAGQSVIEYGPGSGQALLMLARTGVRAFGVDIDQDSLDLVRRQSDAMQLDVALACEQFGEGFGHEKFDRVLFFESFHHALHFDKLLLRLHDRLADGGKIVFCGEPIVPGLDSSVPYPWGPRLDALSVLCMRRHGWMELGFQRDFFIQLLMRHGWLVRFLPSAVFRATAYVATPWKNVLEMGSDFALPSGWSVPEGTHRWTSSERAVLPLPARHLQHRNVSVTLANYLPASKHVTVRAGRAAATLKVLSGKICDVHLEFPLGSEGLAIETQLSRSEADPRDLGIAVLKVSLSAA